MSRHGRTSPLTLLLLAGMAAAGVWVHTFMPYHWDFMEVKQACKEALLTWDETGDRGASQRRLGKELMKLEVDDYIRTSDCTFARVTTGTRIDCAWSVDVFYPGVDRFRTLSFAVGTEMDAVGDIHQE